MDEDETWTLQEWRELKGWSREELAEQAGVDADLIARLEEVGDPTYGAGTRMGERFSREVISPLADALKAVAIRLDVVPEEPVPGYHVLDPLALEELSPEVAEFLGEHAEAFDLRMAVPRRWGVVLKTLEQADTQADAEAIVAWRERNGWR